MNEPAQTHRPQFHGEGGTLFVIHLKNLLLTIITLGIYQFWAKTEVRKYLYSQTSFSGDRFQYHGTGGELMKGWFKAVGIYLLISIAGVIVGQIGGITLGQVTGSIIAQLIIGIGVGFFLVPLALLGSRRYRLSRTSWRGIRFSFGGALKDLLGVYVPGLLLTIFTLGFYFPVYEMNMRHYLVKESRFGNTNFRFEGRSSDIYGQFLLGMFLSVITLGIYYSWYLAFKHRYYWSRTTVAGARFESNVRGGDLFVLTLTNAILLIVTLGIAYPWVQARTMTYYTDNLVLHGSADFNDVLQQLDTATATGAELAEMFDVELVGMDLFGL